MSLESNHNHEDILLLMVHTIDYKKSDYLDVCDKRKIMLDCAYLYRYFRATKSISFAVRYNMLKVFNFSAV